tara:strand:+ start:21 stop:443 length:423 start_codon:yes stop_codon:yes gene_type:complete
MRVENWESKLDKVIHNTVHNKGDYRLGKNDCGLFVVSCIEAIIGQKVFEGKYKSFKQLKNIFKQLKSKDLLDLALNIAKEHNFKTVDISRVQRGDILYYLDTTDLDGTLGVCIGSSTMFNWKDGMQLILNNKCKIAWRIE